ncbi:hypothetical protein RND81_13G022100 [Saponaria officinalis]|uniref:Transferase n=1 Tax=Saponaria officinalis TaxID=3572 RepID=A0AAW1GXT1_SAPOF
MRDQLNNVEVKQISHETLKPSIPTPYHRKSLTLSFIDQNIPHVHMPFLFIYTRYIDKTPSSDIITTLKKSLSDTLTQFYPLAGRCSDQNTVSCNDQGIPFIETCFECSLIHLLNSANKLDLMSKLLPPLDLFSFGQLPIFEVHPLVFQVNLFKCGGLVLGCYMLHKLLDASSISTFLNYWAALASQQNEDLVQPNFDITSTIFPQPQTPATNDGDNSDSAGAALLWHRPSEIKVVAKSFTFDKIAINKLKVEATSVEVPNPTSFEVVAGFVWKNVMSDNGRSVLSFSGNIRARANPPLPREAMGNLIVGAYSSVGQCDNFIDLVKEIHYEVLKLDQKVENLKGINGLDFFLKYRECGPISQGTTMYNLSSWCKLGLNRVDFGFGQPTKIIPYGMVNPLLRNSIILVDYSDHNGDGIEVWLFLEESEMQNLESNSKYLDFASPS